jgi:hypothetical protein
MPKLLKDAKLNRLTRWNVTLGAQASLPASFLRDGKQAAMPALPGRLKDSEFCFDPQSGKLKACTLSLLIGD